MDIEWRTCEMWFEQAGSGLQFKVTVFGRLTVGELLDLAQLNWDGNVQQGCRAITARPA